MATSQKTKKPVQKTPKQSSQAKKPNVFARTKQRALNLRTRRPHKSFLLTRRRDIPKRPKLPGYFTFTGTVFRTIFRYWRTFVPLILVYVVVASALIGVTTQDQYSSLIDSLKDLGPEITGGNIDAVTQTIGLFGVTITGGLNSTLAESQQLYLVLLYLVMWMTGIWLLRQQAAGNIVKMRDALYSGCAPFISTMLVLILMVLQTVPAAIGVLIFSAAQDPSMVGPVSMLLSLAGFLLVILSFYWLASSFFALLIVTLPGTYPMVAIRAAGDIALGRRVPLMFRLGWLILVLLLLWTVVLVPFLLLDAWLNISGSFAPIAVQILTGFSLVFVTAYFYLLYRGMIDERIK